MKVKDEKTHQSFEYKWASIKQTPHSFEWTPVIQQDATYDHVRCHDVQPGGNLPAFLANLDNSPGTKALILINTENSCIIDSSLLPEDHVSVLPVLTIAKKSGNTLTHLIKENEPGTVKVKVHCFPASTQSIESASAETEEAPKLSNESMKPEITPEMKPYKKVDQADITEQKASIESANVETEKAPKLSKESMKPQIAPEMKPYKKPDQADITKQKASYQQKDSSKYINI